MMHELVHQDGNVGGRLPAPFVAQVDCAGGIAVDSNDVRKLVVHYRIGYITPKPGGFQYVCFVDRAKLEFTLLRKLAGDANDALDFKSLVPA